MATDFSRMGCDELLSYAQGGVNAAAGAGCPKAKANYQAALYSIQAAGCGWGEDENVNARHRTMLQQADTSCHAEAYGPGGAKAASTAGRTVQPKATTTTPSPQVKLPGVAKAGFSPWLIIGGLGLALLLFGKKKR